MAILFPSLEFRTLDDGGSENNAPPVAILLHAVARGVNHLAGRHRRVLFNQHLQPADQPTTTTNPLFRFRYNQNFGHGKQLSLRGIFLARAAAPPAAQSPRFRGNDGTTEVRFALVNSGTITEELSTATADINEAITVANSFQARQCGVLDTLRPVSVAVVERRAADHFIDTAADTPSMVPSRFLTGQVVDRLQQLDVRDAIDLLWKRLRRVFAAWSAPGFADAAARSVTSQTFTNLVDLASTSRTANTPGLICPGRYCARGQATVGYARGAVYASLAAGATGTGEVRFQSGANTTDLTGITTTPGWWETAASAIQISANADYDKVDVFGRATDLNQTLRVWAWMLMEEPV